MWYVFDANSPGHQTLFQSGWFVVGLLTQAVKGFYSRRFGWQ
nr:hypothetical protein [Pseudomonas frederiksbergensis]